MERALVLNASYQPICVVPVRRAVVLVLKEKADVLVPGDGLVRGATLEVQAPSVIRLRYFVKVPFRARAGLSRRAVFVMTTPASTAASEPRTSTTWCPAPVAASTSGRTSSPPAGAATARRTACSTRPASAYGAPRAPKETLWIVIAVGRIEPGWAPFLGLEADAVPAQRLRRPTGSLHDFATRIAPWALPLLAGALGAVLAVTFLARQEVTVGPAGPAGGRGRARVQPAGRAPLRVGLGPDPPGPLAFRATIDDVDVKRLGRLLEGSPAPRARGPRFAELEATLGPWRTRPAGRPPASYSGSPSSAWPAGWPRCCCSRAGPAAAAALRPRRPDGHRLLLGPALATYDLTAFREPRYDGALEYAPALIGDVRTGLDRLRTLREEMVRIGRNLAAPTPPWPARSARSTAPAPCGSARLRRAPQPGRVRPGRAAGRPVRRGRGGRHRRHGHLGTAHGAAGGGQRRPLRRAVPVRQGQPRRRRHGRGRRPQRQRPGAGRHRHRRHPLLRGRRPDLHPGKGYQVEEFEELKVERSVGVADAVDRQALRPDVLLVHDGRLAAYARGHVATVLEGHLHRSAPRSSTAPGP